jgi:hypothetical protein
MNEQLAGLLKTIIVCSNTSCTSCTLGNDFSCDMSDRGYFWRMLQRCSASSGSRIFQRRSAKNPAIRCINARRNPSNYRTKWYTYISHRTVSFNHTLAVNKSLGCFFLANVICQCLGRTDVNRLDRRYGVASEIYGKMPVKTA